MKGLKVVSVFVTMTIVLATAPGVMAVRPAFWTADGQGAGIFDSCGDFEIWDEWTVHVEGRDVYDSEGNYLHTTMHIVYTDHFVNLANGKELPATKGAHSYRVIDDEGATSHGLLVNVVVPGMGTVFIDAGWISHGFDQQGIPIDWIFHGNHQLLEGDLSELCAALR